MTFLHIPSCIGLFTQTVIGSALYIIVYIYLVFVNLKECQQFVLVCAVGGQHITIRVIMSLYLAACILHTCKNC